MIGWDCLKLLTISERLRFEANYNHTLTLNVYYSRDYDNPGEFISSAFYWGDTPEGNEYWFLVYDRIKNGEPKLHMIRFNKYEKKIMI